MKNEFKIIHLPPNFRIPQPDFLPPLSDRVALEIPLPEVYFCFAEGDTQDSLSRRVIVPNVLEFLAFVFSSPSAPTAG